MEQLDSPPYASPPPPARPPVQSPDGRWVLTDEELTLDGRHYSLLELERVAVQRVRWLLWLLLGAFVLGGFTLAFLQNWLRTPTAMLGMTIGTLLLAWGQRGATRVRLLRLGQEPAHHALPGELAGWQQLATDTNARIHQRHQRAAAEALALLLAQQAAEQAAAEAARQAAEQAEAEAEAARPAAEAAARRAAPAPAAHRPPPPFPYFTDGQLV